MTLEMVTFGCRLNSFESEIIRREASAAGLADTAIVNTCAVTAEAVRQARQTIRRIRRQHPGRRVVVTGCAAQTAPEAFAAMAEVDRVVGNDDKVRAAAWRATRAALEVPAPEHKIAVSDIMTARSLPVTRIERHEDRVRAFVQVQNGCEHRCTFCIIPFGRGNSRSVPMRDVVAQIRRLVANRYREVVLTGVDITSYGADLPSSPTLGALVGRILREVPELTRLRLSSIDAVEVDRELIETFAQEPRLMPHLHLSLQAGDDLVLKRMKRRHRRSDAIAFCQTMRRLRPDIVFGGDIIAGFPTETEEMFARSLDIVDECGLTQLHVFPFSLRPGTPAARMPQVPGAAIRERASRLRQKGFAALARHLDGEVGKRRRVLTETRGLGRTEQFLAVSLPRPAEPGAILEVTIAEHDGRRLIAG